MKRHLATCAFLAVLVCGVAAAEEVSTTVAAPVDRVWTVTEAVLRQLGWDVDKADRSIGWITTGSRGLEGEDYGVYAKGIRHRLRIRIKDAGAGQTTVAIERTVFKRERILFVDNDEPIATTDRSVEQAVLDAIRKAL
jgi:uncharacterized lipoprotein